MSLLSQNIDAFIAVARIKTVHGAAKEIGLTQTGVTQRLRSLERELGITLFTRSRKGMQLTKEGERLYLHSLKVKEMEGELFANLKGEKANIRIKLTGPSSIMRTRVVPELSTLKKKYPYLSFTFNIDDEDNGLSLLKSGETDLAIIQREQVVNELDSKLLKSERYYLVGPTCWQKRSIKEIIKNEHIVDFNENDKFTTEYLKQNGLLELSQKERHFINNTDGLVSFVKNGGAYSVLTEEFLKTTKGVGPIMDAGPLLVDFALAWYPRHEMPEYFKEIISLIK